MIHNVQKYPKLIKQEGENSRINQLGWTREKQRGRSRLNDRRTAGERKESHLGNQEERGELSDAVYALL